MRLYGLYAVLSSLWDSQYTQYHSSYTEPSHDLLPSVGPYGVEYRVWSVKTLLFENWETYLAI
jgi:hypothetical protein